MKQITKNKLEYFKKAYRELIRYKGLSMSVVVLSFASAVFDGFSIGAIVPFMQNLVDADFGDVFVFPVFEKLQQSLMGGVREDILLKLMIFALVMVILKSIFNYLRIVISKKVTMLVRRDFQDELFGAIADSSLKFYNTMKIGGAVSGIAVYTEGIANFILSLLNILTNLVRVLVYIVLLIFISWQFTLVAIAFQFIILPLIRVVFIKVKKINFSITQEVSNLHSRMIEMFDGVRIMKVFGTESREKKHFNSIITRLAQLNYHESKYFNAVTPISEVLVFSFIIILLIFGFKVFDIEVIKILPFVATFMYIFLRLFNEISRLFKTISNLFRYGESYKAYEKILYNAQKSKMIQGTQKVFSFKDKIFFDKVSFGYDDHQVLDAVNFEITCGQFTAIVGPTGAGKTTIANLLVGLYFPDSGCVKIDGVDISTVDMHSWRQLVGYIGQEIIIFNDTIKNNIAYAYPDASNQEVEKAAKIANIHEFINGLENGYDTQVGEKGANLSGGQRQRLAIARAIIRDPQILILDEATSSLDIETEKQVQEALNKVMQGRTVIAIAHRLSTVSHADNILVLHDSKIIEQGNHKDLLKQQGVYQRYFELQLSK